MQCRGLVQGDYRLGLPFSLPFRPPAPLTVLSQPGPDAYEVVPDSTLVVARTAYRNNSSKYTINNKNSTFTEVTTLLKDRGIDLDHKRFLILQGEVESIAQMKPKAPNEHEDGLLEYLEDIIGTSRVSRADQYNISSAN